MLSWHLDHHVQVQQLAWRSTIAEGPSGQEEVTQEVEARQEVQEAS